MCVHIYIYTQQAPDVYITSGWHWTWRGQMLHFGWKWKSGWRQYLTSIWRWINIGFWLHNLKTTKSQCQLTSVSDINLTLILDVGFTLNFGHPTSQPKCNQISTSYDVVCLLCACWVYIYIYTYIYIYIYIHIYICIYIYIYTHTHTHTHTYGDQN